MQFYDPHKVIAAVQDLRLKRPVSPYGRTGRTQIGR